MKIWHINYSNAKNSQSTVAFTYVALNSKCLTQGKTGSLTSFEDLGVRLYSSRIQVVCRESGAQNEARRHN